MLQHRNNQFLRRGFPPLVPYVRESEVMLKTGVLRWGIALPKTVLVPFMECILAHLTRQSGEKSPHLVSTPH